MATRRQFIKAGIAGAALLAAARFLDRPLAAPVNSYRLLDEKGERIVRTIVPVVLEGVLPADPDAHARAIGEVVTGFDHGASILGRSAQEELGELFSFLDFPPTRIAFAGLWQPFAESTADEIRRFLTRWRHSRFELQQASYQALTQLILAAWYSRPAAWPAIAYPGPPKLDAS